MIFLFFSFSVDKIATKLSDSLTAAMDFSFSDSWMKLKENLLCLLVYFVL